MSEEWIHIRESTLGDLKDVKTCARDAYSKYIDRMGGEPAAMNADFGDLIARDRVHVALPDSKDSKPLSFRRMRR